MMPPGNVENAGFLSYFKVIGFAKTSYDKTFAVIQLEKEKPPDFAAGAASAAIWL